MRTTMSEEELDDLTHAVAGEFEKQGVSLGDGLLCELNECLSDFLVERCAIKIEAPVGESESE